MVWFLLHLKNTIQWFVTRSHVYQQITGSDVHSLTHGVVHIKEAFQ